MYADMKSKIKRIAKLHNLDEQKAKEKIIKTEKTRKTYYNYYTDKVWGDMASYDLCINTGKVSIEQAIEVIKGAVLEG